MSQANGNSYSNSNGGVVVTATLGILILLLVGISIMVLLGGSGNNRGGGTGYVIVLFVAFMLIILGIQNSRKPCPPPIVEYRFVPRTFQEEQENPASISNVFGDMFAKPSPWIGSGTLGKAAQTDRVQ